MQRDPQDKVYKPLLFGSLNFLYSYMNWMLLAYLPIYLKQLGISDSTIGAMVSMFSLTTLVAILPAGILSDRLLAGRIIQYGALLYTLYPLGLLLTERVSYIFLGIFLGGIGSATMQVFLNSLFYKALPGDKRGLRVALFFIGGSVGFSLGPLTGGLILTYFHIRSIFYLVTGLAGLIFLVARHIRESLVLSFPLLEYGRDLLKAKTWLLLLSVFTVATHIGVEQTTYSLFLKQTLSFSDFQVGLLYSIIGLWVGSLSLLTGYIFDRGQKSMPLLGSAVFLSGMFQWITAYASSFWGLFLIRILHTLGDAFYLTINAILISLVFPQERLGGNIGLIFTVHMLAIFSGALFSGFINDRYGYAYSFMASGLVLMTVAVFLLANCGRLERTLRG